MRTQDLTYDETGQSVFLDCPEGRPSSVTSVEMFEMSRGDDDTAETALGTPAVETNPDTTVDAASGYGQADPTKISLTATTGINAGTDQPYLLTGANGEKEWVEVLEVAAGDYAKSRVPLRNAYAASDTFESVRITAAILDAWIQDEDHLTDDRDPNPGYRIRWTYVVGGVTYVRHTFADVVRYAGGHTVRPIDVELYSPGFLDSLTDENYEDRGRRLIDVAWRLGVKPDLHTDGVADEMIRSEDVINLLVILKTLQLKAEANFEHGQGSLELAEFARERFYGYRAQFFRDDSKVATATDTSGAGRKAQAVPYFRK